MVLRPRHGLSLCAGGGGLDMGLMLAEPGFHTRAFVEWEEYPRSVLIAAQRAGYFAPAPIWDDLTTFDGRPFCGAFDAILAGYPCQPFSQAGQRRGADDERHLWPDVARVIREVEPEWVFLENVAGHVSLGAETVLRELWEMGWTPAAGLFSASETGASHERLRVFIVAHRRHAGPSRAGGWAQHGSAIRQSGDDGRGEVAHPDGGHPGAERQQRGGEQRLHPESRSSGGGCAGIVMADASGAEREGQFRGQHHQGRWQVKDGYPALQGGTGLFPPGPGDAAAWADALAVAPHLAPAAGLADCIARASNMAAALEWQGQAAAEHTLRRMADGLASRSRALRLLGNGVVPLAAAYAWRTLAAAHGLGPVDMGAAECRAEAGANRDVRRMTK